MIYFWLGFAGVVVVINGLLMYEFQEHLLWLDNPEPKSKGWRM